MADEDVFEHRGHSFRVANQDPNPANIEAGQWVRICYDPYDSKDDIVARVLSCRKIRRNSPYCVGPSLINDYLLRLARDGDQADTFNQFYSDHEAIEVVTMMRPPTVGSDENLSVKQGRDPLNIVVCLDGTWNENERQDTNAHRIVSFVDKERAIMNYYSGVGVGGMRMQNGFDGMTGRGVFRTVRSAFTFVRANYCDGDRIFIFGFSRGAYAARHLGGMIARVGINAHPEIGYEDYRRSVVRADSNYTGRTGTKVHFLGLFDCVPGNQIYSVRAANRLMNNPHLEPNIRNFAHAVSRDERRWSFRPLMFERHEQDLFEQRWFPGCHFDIGGDENPDLNNFALVWMLTRAHRCGLLTTSGLSQPFKPSAPKKPHEYLTTKCGFRCTRSQMTEARLVDSEIDTDELRKDISALTRLKETP